MKKLKIVFFDFDDIRNPMLNAGQARATYEVGKRLAKLGHKVIVYAGNYPGAKSRIEDKIHYKHIGVGTKFLRLNNLIYIFSVPYYAMRIKADIIIESFVAPVSTIGLPKFTNIPVIGLPSMFNAKAFSKKYRLPFHLIEKLGSKAYKYFLPYSDTDSKKMLSINPSVKYKIVPQGVDESYFKIKHNKAKHILFLSRFDIEQKGIDLLLKSYKKVVKKINLPLVLAGHGPDRKKIEKIIEKLNLNKEVKIYGPAYGEDKAKLISEAAFAVFPSRHDEISLWTLEALAAGLPLVAFDLPESRWIDNAACLKAKPFSIDQYSKYMLKALNINLNKQMRISARKLASKYKWENVAHMTNNFISDVLIYEKKYK